MHSLSVRTVGKAENTGKDSWIDQWMENEVLFLFLLILMKWEARPSIDAEKGRGCGRYDWEVNSREDKIT